MNYLTKRRKMIRLAEVMNSLRNSMERYYGVKGLDFSSLNSVISDIANLTYYRKSDDTKKKDANGVVYQAFIDLAMVTIRNFFSAQVTFPLKPVLDNNGTSIDSIDHYFYEHVYTFIHAPETDHFESGSLFTCVLSDEEGNQYSVRKLSDEKTTHIYGMVVEISDTSYVISDLLKSFNCGMYTIKREGDTKTYRFDIRNAYHFRLSWYTHDDEHPLLDNNLGITRINESDIGIEPACYSCGDGGCLSCHPEWFVSI
ncbi:hypothetical protein [Bacillus alkalicellulosilyticus]|uniref:hypothetical protein n=1 Tax=Alkalihalobacterium alkalicellulosilyticum TaxID=1912214 RepID=UPI0009972975|nr:hypothetical protein [Bacillus alkalicellulosilyticus]